MKSGSAAYILLVETRGYVPVQDGTKGAGINAR